MTRRARPDSLRVITDDAPTLQAYIPCTTTPKLVRGPYAKTTMPGPNTRLHRGKISGSITSDCATTSPSDRAVTDMTRRHSGAIQSDHAHAFSFIFKLRSTHSNTM